MDARTNLVEVAARLLREQGPAAVTTRGVAHAAGVQAPAIYRMFGDKDGLLDAVAEHVFATYIAEKSRVADSDDPLADLRAGWDTHVGFGLANPALFVLLVGRPPTSATIAGIEKLRAKMRRVAAIGRLRVSEERAVELLHAANTGVVLTLLTAPSADPGLADAMYETVTRTILTDAPAFGGDGPVAAAVAFRTVVPDLPALSDTERALLSEWLDRAAKS